MRKKFVLLCVLAAAFACGALIACGGGTDGHTLVKTAAQDPTCTAVGNIEYYTCSDCGKVYADSKAEREIAAGDTVVAPLGHDYAVKHGDDDHWMECTRCDASTRHKDHLGGEATCTVLGKCEVCGVSYGAMLPHTFNAHVIDDKYLKTAATCLETGVYYVSCSVCGEKDATETFRGTALGDHAYTAEVAEDEYFKSAATCVDKAVYYKSCAVCGEKHATETFEEGEALGHDFAAEFTIDVAETCTTDGSKSKHCSRCDVKNEVTVIEKLGHDFAAEFTIDVAETCTTDGSKSKHCSRCDVKNEVTVIEKLGHDIRTTYTYNADFTECTARYGCSRCDDSEETETSTQITIDETASKAPTCTAEGYNIVTVTFQNDKFVQAAANVPLAALGHTLKEDKADVVEATTTSQGSYKQVIACTVCHETLQEERTVTVFKTPDNTENQMFRRHASGSIELDRAGETQFVDGVDYVKYYVYTASNAKKEDYVGTFKLTPGKITSMDGTLECAVNPDLGNMYFNNTGDPAPALGAAFKAIMAKEVKDFDPTAKYYFAVQTIAKADTVYVDSAISAIGTQEYFAKLTAPINDQNQMITNNGQAMEFDRQGSGFANRYSVFGKIRLNSAGNDTQIVSFYEYVDYVVIHIIDIDRNEVGQLKWVHNANETGIRTMDDLNVMTGYTGSPGNLYAMNENCNFFEVVKAALGDKYSSDQFYRFAVSVKAVANWGIEDSDMSDVGTYCVYES